MPYIDFAALKSRVSIMQAAQMLNLSLKQTGNQQRGPCPICNSGGDRALVITPERGLFYCFVGKVGGDLIKLVAHIKVLAQNDAAQLIRSRLGGAVSAPTSEKAAAKHALSPAPQKPKAGLNPLSYLEPEHPAVQGLGISPETAKTFESGYAGKGVLRGRYAVPVHERDGMLLAYVGIAVSKDQSPQFLFHNFDPRSVIFNAHRLGEGSDVWVCRDPLQSIIAVENGIALESVVSFLSGEIVARQLEMLVTLMNDNKREPAHFC